MAVEMTIFISMVPGKVPAEQKPELVRRLSDRHFGIGGDGVIFINPSDQADFEMEMYNMTEPVQKCAETGSAVWPNMYMIRD